MVSKEIVASQSMKRVGHKICHLLEATSSGRKLADFVDGAADLALSCVSSKYDHPSISLVENSAGSVLSQEV